MGIDYGMGKTNIDTATGIRFGVIPLNTLSEYAIEDFEADYGEATCGHCGNAAVEYDDEKHGEYEAGAGCSDYACEDCERSFDSSDAYGEDPIGHTLDDGEYKATLDTCNDVFIVSSPYFTYAGFCSPCAPGACYLTDRSEDAKAYCFGHDWFADGVAPYPVYRVDTGELVQPEAK